MVNFMLLFLLQLKTKGKKETTTYGPGECLCWAWGVLFWFFLGEWVLKAVSKGEPLKLLILSW